MSIRSALGPAWVAKAVAPAVTVGARTAVRKHGYLERINARRCDALRDGALYYPARQPRTSSKTGTIRPHSSVGYRPPAPEMLIPLRGLPGSADRPAMHYYSNWISQSGASQHLAARTEIKMAWVL